MQVIKDAVQRWLDDVVIGLNLCPFAAKPNRQKVIRIEVCHATSEQELSAVLLHELALLSNTPAQILETTLLVIPDMLQDFYDYNDYLDEADRLLVEKGFEGELQIASFHPDYQFAGTDAADAENLTNRSPYPILHLIREESLEEVLAKYPDPDSIPENNIRRVQALTEQEKRQLFPFLFR